VSLSASATIDVLQRKIRTLENENVSLQSTIRNISSSADDLDEREAGLVSDCVRELSDANERMNKVHEELSAKSELVIAHQYKIEQLMLKIGTLERTILEVCCVCTMLFNCYVISPDESGSGVPSDGPRRPNVISRS